VARNISFFLILLFNALTVYSQGSASLSIYNVGKGSYFDRPDEIYKYFFDKDLLTKIEKWELNKGQYLLNYTYEVERQDNLLRAVDKKNNKEILIERLDQSNYKVLTKSSKTVYVRTLADRMYISDLNSFETWNEDVVLKDGYFEFRFSLNVKDETIRRSNYLQDIKYSDKDDVVQFVRKDRQYKKYSDDRLKKVDKGYYEYVSIDAKGNTTDTAYIIMMDMGDADSQRAVRLSNYLLLRYIDVPDLNAIKIVLGSVVGTGSFLTAF